MQYRKPLLQTIFFVLFAMSACSPRYDKTLPQAVVDAMSVLWDDPQAAQAVLMSVSADSLMPYQRACYDLTFEHARLKTGYMTDTVALGQSLKLFLSMGDKRHAGEVAYVLGANADNMGRHYDAARLLKQAEELLASCTERDSVPPVLLGMVNYKLGMTFESDQLYKEANKYYCRALPCFLKTTYHLYIACTLRDMARTARWSDKAADLANLTAYRDSLFNEALTQAQLYGDTIIYLDILDYSASYAVPRDTAMLLSISRYMTNVLHQPRYAGDLAEYYLSCHYLDSARICLDIFASDTATEAWSRERWYYLQSRYLLGKGDKQAAYEMLNMLYQNRQRRIVSDGEAKTYAIARQYDLLREQERNLRLRVAQQRLYIVLAVLVGTLVAMLLLWLLYRQRNRRREAEQYARIQTLNSELSAKRDSMRRQLSERVVLTQRMQLSQLIVGHRKDELPEWAQTFIQDQLITKPEQWEQLLSEFNAASNNLLVSLKSQHPALTKTDQLISALILLGLSIQDICILLNQSKRTIWSRRQRIKTHLGLGEDDNLDDWLRQRLAES